MHTYDPEKAARVWQRVQNQKPDKIQPPREDNMAALIMAEWEQAATYLQLARQLPSRQASVLQRLSREEQAHGACLKGIHTLITGEPPVIQTPPIPREPPKITLRRCYGRQMQALREYEKRSEDPEYGPVFRRLAEQEREHCRSLLELIGSMQDSSGR